ncbi:multicopper oxidase family protein [Ornithinimicrobium cerasi]|uniref:Multicopper oxidase with three cupredoxin domains (Includes cell division protein FtsP and spore coat protein CotA) n=1 Tax=Ornithinimicrobium cerasi TaxID=2248773 RepID=A0A285VIG7_9MICO|nr:multicopper oxidase domain-containing protein [Ornithinimicrobium cerasi]SOC53783.1 Multicopper oxidase with three cupredoxin domains (includes cell division protein FtsP and spore coat protein CotA) [Ornithinimicrobium cerasi]
MGTLMINRRTVLHAGLVGGLLAAAGGTPALGKPGGGGGGGAGTTGNLLQTPPVLTDGTLRAARTSINLGGRTGSALTYNGFLPGPTIVARPGETRTLTVTNALDEPTTVHWHGLVVPTAVDGQPHEAFGPGASFTYALPVQQRASLNFYHPHPHARTAAQVALGLQGAFIIRDAEEDRLNLPAGAYEVPLVLRDANVDKAGALTYNGRASGFLGSVPLVNGTLDPYLPVDKAVYRLRVVNAANSRVFRIAFADGRDMTLIGTDGGLLGSAVRLNEITLGNAERMDLLVDLRGSDYPTQPLSLLDLDSGWTLLRLTPKPQPVSVAFAGLPSTLPAVTPLSSPVRSRTFSFDGMTAINGVRYDMRTIAFQVPRGQVERWTFVANGNPPHPVHIHGASFQLVERRGGRGRLYAWEGGWKDSFLLLDKESVDILIRFDIPGRYLIHCHKLEHEDAGMMLNFEVTEGVSSTMASGVTGAQDQHASHHG